MLYRLSVVVVVLTMLVGCGMRYAQPGSSDPSAEMHIVSAVVGTTTSNTYLAYTTSTCDDRAGDGYLAGFGVIGGSDKSVRIPADKPFYLLAEYAGTTTESVSGGAAPGTTQISGKLHSCRTMASFVPESGHKYEVKQASSVTNCPIPVTEAASGAVPSSFSLLGLTGKCPQR
jgi:hypothetical protein